MMKSFLDTQRNLWGGLLLLLGGMTAALPCAASEWTVYPAVSQYAQMDRLGDRIYITSQDGGLFCYNPTENSTQTLTRLDGLSGSSVAKIVANETHSILAVVYTDGDIDLLYEDGSQLNLPDLKNKSLPSKTIRNAQICNDKLYISADFGFTIVNLVNGYFEDSYMMDEPCRFAFSFGGALYRGTESGFYRCPAELDASRSDSWQQLYDKRITNMLIYEDNGEPQCYVGFLDAFNAYLQPDGSFQQRLTQAYLVNAAWMGDKLLTSSGCVNIGVPSTNEVAWCCTAYYAACVDYLAINDTMCYALHPTDGVLQLHLSDYKAGYSFSFEEEQEPVNIQAPMYSALQCLTYTDGVLGSLVAAPQKLLWNEVNRLNGMLVTFDEEEGWTHLPISKLKGAPDVKYNFQDLTSLAADPRTPGRYAVGSTLNGLYIIEGDSIVEHYDENNSPLDVYWRARVSGLKYDADGNLWMGNYNESSATLKALLANGQWMSYPIAGFDDASVVSSLLVSQYDPYKFIWLTKTPGEWAMYYTGGTLENLNDDDAAHFDALIDQDGNSNTPSLYGLVEDKNGAVWILTEIGPFVSDSPIETFRNKGVVRRIKIPRNDGTNLADYLLADVDTRCMVVDAANRKWIGTYGSGLYLISADGLTTIEHFTTENSPLLSDDILSLTMDEATGRLFISVDGGIFIYRSDAVTGRNDFSEVYCYPNPVRPEYTGDLCVSGLMDGSQVRITDINNNVLYAATSSGGAITWNLQNRDGKRVRSGVYLVYGVDANGKSGVVSKFLVVR